MKNEKKSLHVLLMDINILMYRKGGLLLNNVLGISGACLMGFTKFLASYEMLFLGRFIIGVNCGMYLTLNIIVMFSVCRQWQMLLFNSVAFYFFSVVQV